MTVRDYVDRNGWKNIKFRVDDNIWGSEKDIPESVMALEVKSYVYHGCDYITLWMRTEKTHREEDCVW